MVMRVQHFDGEYRVVLTPEAMKALHLSDGAEVEVKPVVQTPTQPASKYVTADEAIESYFRTEPLHINTYRELAK